MIDTFTSRAAPSTAAPKVSPPPARTTHRLWSLAWKGVSIFPASSIKDKLLAGPAVVTCQNESELRRAQEWKRATGADHPLTYVVFTKNDGLQSWVEGPTA
eukprot:6243236-Pyramimonas_sp.AAC.1